MNANELMIGDWLLYKGKPIKVEEILTDGINPMWDGCENYGNEAYFTDLQPIPITKDILKENGFRYDIVGISASYYIYDKIDWANGAMWIGDRYDNYQSYVECKYVHELQHWLKVLGIDKEIKL